VQATRAQRRGGDRPYKVTPALVRFGPAAYRGGGL